MAQYIKAFTTTCPSELMDSINANGSITPTLLQIINTGDSNSIFDFTSTLSGGEETELDNVLAAWVCPDEAGGPDNPVDNQDFDDTAPPGPDVIWSSEQITNNFADINTTLSGQKSVSGGGDLSANRTFELVNDQDTPGNDKLYGTNGSGTKGWYDQPSGGSSTFGSEHQEEASEGKSSTSSTSYQLKVNMTTGSLPSGLYRIGWYCEVKNNNTSSRSQVRVRVGSSTIGEPSIEAEDSDDYVPFCGYKYETLSGVKTIDLYYRKQENSGTTCIRYARLEIWRIS